MTTAINFIRWRNDKAPQGLLLRNKDMSVAYSSQLHEGEVWSVLPASEPTLDVSDIEKAVKVLREIGEENTARKFEREMERISNG